MEGETDSIILLDTVLQNILSGTVQHRILIFVGHCLAESILLDTVLQRIFCWTLLCTEYFVRHCPAEREYFIGYYPAEYFVGYCPA